MNLPAIVFLGQKPDPNHGRWFFLIRLFLIFEVEVCHPFPVR